MTIEIDPKTGAPIIHPDLSKPFVVPPTLTGSGGQLFHPSAVVNVNPSVLNQTSGTNQTNMSEIESKDSLERALDRVDKFLLDRPDIQRDVLTVLKNNGCDSMQQAHALADIMSLLDKYLS